MKGHMAGTGREAGTDAAAGELRRDPELRHDDGGSPAAASDGPFGLRAGDAMKRLADMVVGSVLALVTLPVMALLAAAVAVTLRCSPLFFHERVGRGGRHFRMVKLRTLPTGTPTDADKFDVARMPLNRLSRLMRATHLDELPQLFLVAVGRMSLVGPRPEMPRLHATLEPRFAQARTAVRPGCTGVWQISVARARLIGDDPAFDELYLARRSWALDFWVLGRTALVLLRLAPPVELGDIPRWALRAGR